MTINPLFVRSSLRNVTASSCRRLPGSQIHRNFWWRSSQSANTISSPLTGTPSSVKQLVRPFSSLPPAKTSKDGVVGHPIDFDVNSKIEGQESQIVTISLEPGQVLRAESGAMMYMTNGVNMNTTSGGGISEGFKRMLTGQNFFISDYTYEGDPGTTGKVCLGTDFPSKILVRSMLVCLLHIELYSSVRKRNFRCY